MEDLLGSYLRYAARLRFDVELLHVDEGSASVLVRGSGVDQAFQYEPGKHVVQRYPRREKRGRRHTSTITVAVLPLLPARNFELAEGEIRVTTQGGHGKGGQHQNKRDSAVRMVHLPTGVEVFVNGRDQHQNRRRAREILTRRIAALRDRSARRSRNRARRGQVGDGGRANKVRTYNFIDSRVVDHRLGTRTTQIRQVMRGRLELLFPEGSGLAGQRGPPVLAAAGTRGRSLG